MPDREDLDIRYHAVCVLDILGQKHGLEGWSDVPENLEPTPSYLHALQRTVGVVVNLREMFKNFFATCDRGWISGDDYARMDAQQREVYERYRDCLLRTQQFSDTFIFYSPLMNSSGELSATPLYRILAACCMAMSSSLASKIAVRGGVCIGIGAEVAPHSLYGPALAKAHWLENKIAKYPRIVVSPEVPSFLRQMRTNRDECPSEIMALLAEVCESMLCMDTDNWPIVDFIGKGYQQIVGGENAKAIEGVSKAYSFVTSERRRFHQDQGTGLEERYGRLQDYMQSRLHLWGLSPDGEKNEE